ncbi:MAG: NAD(P)/FAD-dependent oxidoreductase [Bacilli bacterium]
MITIRQIEVNIKNDSAESLKKAIAKKTKLNLNSIKDYIITKKSIDARKKPEIYYVYEVNLSISNEEEFLIRNKNKDIFKTNEEKYSFSVTGTAKLTNRPVICGSGPAGLFTAYLLAEHGYKPIIIERGKKVEERIKDVEEFWETNKLNPESNVQFGEGGAGTFSDGKLNTLIKNTSSQRKVFETLVECGADKSILYLNKPHIGTDVLCKIIITMRKKIISMGGEIKYSSKLTDLVIENNELKQIIINNQEKIDTNILVLAIGHSARDTFKMLSHYLKMESKPFAVGVRIMHNQEDINKSQYGESYKYLPNASYNLTHQTKDGRGVYTFCMCPGGFVVNASSENNMLAVNGMSNNKRDEEVANSAVVVTVNNKDFGNDLFSGMEFQRKLESKAYELGKGLIPVNLYKDYKENKISTEFKDIKPLTKGKTSFANLNDLFPDFINKSLKEGIEAFDKKINGFANPNSILAGVESRTSSPIRILRNDNKEANIKGVYPCGEGAGYAGGITSAATDGIRIALAIASRYEPLKKK